MRAAARLQLHAAIEAEGCLPFVATVCGYPVVVAEVISTNRLSSQTTGQDGVRLDLRPAGAWSRLLDRKRLVTPRGPAWLLVEPGRRIARLMSEAGRLGDGQLGEGRLQE